MIAGEQLRTGDLVMVGQDGKAYRYGGIALVGGRPYVVATPAANWQSDPLGILAHIRSVFRPQAQSIARGLSRLANVIRRI